MKWATRALIHFDRVASAWLIRRFVDSEAQFLFLEDGETAGDDATLFGIVGARLAPHDAEATTFQRILEAYHLTDPALAELGRIGAAVVLHVMHDPMRASAALRNPLVNGLLAIADGIVLLSATDDECLARSLPIYDALYVRLQAGALLEQLAPSASVSVLDQTKALMNATRALRMANRAFSTDSFALALRSASSAT